MIIVRQTASLWNSNLCLNIFTRGYQLRGTRLTLTVWPCLQETTAETTVRGGGDALTSPVQVTTHSSITLSTHMCVHVCVFTVYVCMLGVCIDMNPVIYSVSVIDWSGLSSFLPLTVGCSSVTTGRSCRYRWRNWWVWLRPVHSRFPPPLQT